MGHFRGFLLFLTVFAIHTAASAQDIVIDPNDLTADKVTEALTKKGKDWLKGKAKGAGKDWVFETGQSDTMRQILDAALQRANGEGNDKRPNCQGAVMGTASTILTNLNYKTNVQIGAKLALETTGKMAALASGFGAAAGEGGALNWLIGKYADAAKDKAKDSAFDAIKKLFIDEKRPQFEIYETAGKAGNCDYKLSAVWDIVHGTYKVFISGDCHCELVGNVGVAPQRLGKWWISFEGHLKVTVDTTKKEKTIKWIVLPANKMDFDAQCDCSKKELKKPFAETQVCPPPPAKPQLTPEERAKVQTEIDAKTKALEEEEARVRDLSGQMAGAQSQGDQKAIKEIKEKSYESEAKQTQLKKEIADLKKRLESGSGGVPAPVAPAKTSSGVSYDQDSFAGGLLAYHNKLRAAVGSPPLQWSPVLAGHAQSHANTIADTGQPEHSSRLGRENERENVSLGMRGASNPLQLAQVWGTEQRFFRFGIFPDISTTDDWSDVGHYSQIVWSETTEMGCGFVRGRRVDALVCRYSPPGNQDGEPVIRIGLTYEFAGAPCTPTYQETSVPMPEIPDKEVFKSEQPEKLDDPL